MGEHYVDKQGQIHRKNLPKEPQNDGEDTGCFHEILKLIGIFILGSILFLGGSILVFILIMNSIT